jgi:transglycosylase-like protein with SLT domain
MSRALRRRRLPSRPRARSRMFRALRAAPLVLQLVAAAVLSIGLWAAANWVYHAVRKPTELLFPVSSTLSKSPSETWREYGPHFRKYATPVIAPELLAALAQVESAGNPLARTYWRWRPTLHPFELYRPASSAVGMYQITDATFAETNRECLYEPTTREDDFVRGLRFCWFDGLYARVVPSHAVALTATLLDRSVASALKRQRIAASTLQHKQDLAAVIHLCGAGAGETYARRGFRLTSGQRCGDHDVRAYLQRVNGMKRLFAQLARNS